MSLVVIILSFNSQASIAKVIQSCEEIATRILVVDSFSSDKTMEIVHSFKCEVVQHAFENYAKQRNWAQQYAQLNCDDWVLHLDSDEVLSPQLQNSLYTVLKKNSSAYDGYLIQRRIHFLGKPIHFGHLNPNWQLRLFKAHKGSCEQRFYDQHFIVLGKTKKIPGLLLDLQLTSIERWTNSHNIWSSAEAQEILAKNEYIGSQLPARFTGDPRMRKRWLKNNVYYKYPPLLRAGLFFFYSYILRLGFLDGKVGLIYHILQAFWFRFLVDAKIIEQQMQKSLNNQ